MALVTVYPSDGDGGVELAPVDPNAVVDYQFDWSTWLDGDTLSTSNFTITNATEASKSNTTTTATVFISGATPGKVVKIQNRITTVGGRTDDRTVNVRVRER